MLLHELACLGKADNRRAAEHGNPDRDPVRPYGDTPLGRYDGKVVRFDLPDKVLGEAWIKLDPKSGEALAGLGNGRSGLGIHGGRGDEKLMPTLGCVRMYDRDFKVLVAAIFRFDPEGHVKVFIQ